MFCQFKCRTSFMHDDFSDGEIIGIGIIQTEKGKRFAE